MKKCPERCFCNEVSRIVYCSRRGLSHIPVGIPMDSLELNMNGNPFSNVSISKVNFTGLPSLEYLYLSECNLRFITINTFSDLKKLRWLDLSNNQLTIINDFTFQGLTLQQLFLSGNKRILIQKNSFGGLKTNGLFLQSCGLKTISLDSLMPLNDSIHNLWLNENNLTYIDEKFIGLFQKLSHLRLGLNPFHCNCKLQWLKELFDENEDIFYSTGDALPPSCQSPSGMKGLDFDDLSMFDFSCQSPVFKNIDVIFETETGKLRCTAFGDPTPILFWMQPNGKQFKFLPSPESNIKFNEAVHILYSHTNDDLSGIFRCLASNEVGNVTLSLNLTWPYFSSSMKGNKFGIDTDILGEKFENDSIFIRYASLDLENGLAITSNEMANIHDILQNVFTEHYIEIDNSKNTNYLYNRTLYTDSEFSDSHHYTVIEISMAVIGAHVLTLILCIILIPIVLKRRWHAQYISKSTRFTTNLGVKRNLDYIDEPSYVLT